MNYKVLHTEENIGVIKMNKRCDRCNALIRMEPSGMMCDGETAERIWYRECPFCGRENHFWEVMK